MRYPVIRLHPLAAAGRAAVCGLFLSAVAGRSAAAQAVVAQQTADATAQRPVPASIAIPPEVAEPHRIRWWEGAAVLGTVGALATEDGNIQEETSEHPSEDASNAASFFRQAGEGKVYTALSLGLVGTGLLVHDRGITRTGLQLAASGAVAAVSFGVLKIVLGRARPDAAEGAYAFHPFTSAGSFPSGHTAMAFALATTLGDASHNPWASAGLYALAAGTAWSRIYNARHWPSDVVMGAALGIAAGKVVNGRWRIFGLRAPRMLVGSRGAGVQVDF